MLTPCLPGEHSWAVLHDVATPAVTRARSAAAVGWLADVSLCSDTSFQAQMCLGWSGRGCACNSGSVGTGCKKTGALCAGAIAPAVGVLS